MIEIKPRRPLDLDDDGYFESNRDYVLNNLDAAVKLLDREQEGHNYLNGLEAEQGRRESSRSSTLARILREIRSKANYESAGFSSFKVPGKFYMDFPFAMPFTTDELTAAIKESTRLHRDSWINPLIDALLEWTAGKKDIRQIERDLL